MLTRHGGGLAAAVAAAHVAGAAGGAGGEGGAAVAEVSAVRGASDVPSPAVIIVTFIVVKLREWVREVLGKGRSTIGHL